MMSTRSIDRRSQIVVNTQLEKVSEPAQTPHSQEEEKKLSVSVFVEVIEHKHSVFELTSTFSGEYGRLIIEHILLKRIQRINRL
jgi:hypothetical protein